MLDTELLNLLCCPETHQAVRPADAALVAQLNQKVQASVLKNRVGQPVKEAIEGGLVRADGKFLYPVRRGIPVMLVDEAIPLLD
ncbi:MAG: hypothetical protein DME25_12965 [Verrucomicrobia bacterium]|nr:MAG: hypothetical protein DME25_12965 [Verrucomicrobiota bacterium]